jgi:urease accessory protein
VASERKWLGILSASHAEVAGSGSEVARVVVSVGPPGVAGGVASLRRLYCSGALAARLTGRGLFLVGAGAHPIGGDRITVELDVAATTALTVRSTSATLARRGPCETVSVSTTTVAVGDYASLCWLVEPGVSATGARHVSIAKISLAPSARLLWREEILLGRHSETVPGSWRTGVEVRRADQPLFVGELDLGPASASWKARSVLSGARALISTLVVDADRSESTWPATTATSGSALGAMLPLAGPGAELISWGPSLDDCRDVMASLLDRLGLAWLPDDASDTA